MREPALRDDLAGRLDELLAQRTDANAQFFGEQAERLARACHATAERFARGGRLIACGHSPAARSDARHVAVEFVHPVIVCFQLQLNFRRKIPFLAKSPPLHNLRAARDRSTFAPIRQKVTFSARPNNA